MINVTGEYAIRAMVALAQAAPEPRTAGQLSEVTQVPAGYLAKIMQQLARRRLVDSRRGLGGGFVLSRGASEINLFQVLEAVDCPPQRITVCPLGITGHEKLCPVHKLLDQAAERTIAAMRAAKLSTLSHPRDGASPLCVVEG